jgi:hypothetical protein
MCLVKLSELDDHVIGIPQLSEHSSCLHACLCSRTAHCLIQARHAAHEGEHVLCRRIAVLAHALLVDPVDPHSVNQSVLRIVGSHVGM